MKTNLFFCLALLVFALSSHASAEVKLTAADEPVSDVSAEAEDSEETAGELTVQAEAVNEPAEVAAESDETVPPEPAAAGSAATASAGDPDSVPQLITPGKLVDPGSGRTESRLSNVEMRMGTMERNMRYLENRVDALERAIDRVRRDR